MKKINWTKFLFYSVFIIFLFQGFAANFRLLQSRWRSDASDAQYIGWAILGATTMILLFLWFKEMNKKTT